MLVLAGAVIGAILGALAAIRRGGARPADIAQYAAGFGIAFGLAGLIATIVIHRMMV
jgi:hypothetical protein